MRNAFADELTSLGGTDPRVALLSGDIGNKLFDKFKAVAGRRFVNCGVAEANMIGMAAGMALNGLRPFVYTITPFTTTRCFEQIRLDLCYHGAPVVVVGTGAGLSYSELGPTHHSCEDIAILRTLPDMVVVCPADSIELRLAMRAALQQDKPVYMRIGKKGEPAVHQESPADFQLGKAITLREGKNVCLISTGNMVHSTLQAADLLQKSGISAQVEDFHTVKPIDEARLKEIFDDFSLVAIIEEHGHIGGLAGAIAEWSLVHDAEEQPRVVTFGVPDAFQHYVGSQAYFRENFGLTPENIAAVIRKA
jgi:transketolase